MPSSLPVFIVGCGDVGRRLAPLLMQQGLPVVALARSPLAADRLIQEGITPYSGDLDPEVSLALPVTLIETLIYLAPPPSTGRADPRMARFLDALQAPPRRIVYISTSGVYGDAGGAWIDESAPLEPKTDRGQRRLHAESLLEAYATKTGTKVLVLRVPGIYGDGRLPEARIRAGLPVVDPAEAPWSNRIHADDLAQACFCAARIDTAFHFRAYNVSDDHPSTMTDYFWQVADHLGLPRPPSIPLAQARQHLTPAMMTFLEESKRLIVNRMRDELGVIIQYPTLAEGLEAITVKAAQRSLFPPVR
jgi:nucleoside-diphosphate-sugar epimerase